MAERFESVFWKLTHAQRLRDQMVDVVRSLQDAWTTEVRQDDDGSRSVHIASVAPQLAEAMAQISMLYADCVHNLRTACDQFAYAATPEANRDTQTAFPIWRDAAVPSLNKLRSAVRNKMRGISKDLEDAIIEWQPYNSGKGHALWVAHILDITDKHHTLTRAGLASSGILFDTVPSLQAMAAGIGGSFEPDQSDRDKWVLHIQSAEPDRLEVGTKLYTENVPADQGVLDLGAIKFVFRLMLDSDCELGNVPTYADEILEMIGIDTNRILRDLINRAG